jgi:hypothetical protein
MDNPGDRLRGYAYGHTGPSDPLQINCAEVGVCIHKVYSQSAGLFLAFEPQKAFSGVKDVSYRVYQVSGSHQHLLFIL